MVRKGGLEPPPLAGPDPKSGASANSATFAWVYYIESPLRDVVPAAVTPNVGAAPLCCKPTEVSDPAPHSPGKRTAATAPDVRSIMRKVSTERGSRALDTVGLQNSRLPSVPVFPHPTQVVVRCDKPRCPAGRRLWNDDRFQYR